MSQFDPDYLQYAERAGDPRTPDAPDMDIIDMDAEQREEFMRDLSASDLRDFLVHACVLINYQRARLAIYSAREQCEKERVAAIQKEWDSTPVYAKVVTV